jgi:hypothetical protein
VGASNLPLFVVRDLVTAPEVYRPHERLVALCIGDHMNTSGTAWPSLARIKDWTGLGMTSVREALVTLCSGPRAIFTRTVGGARPGARYEPTRYTLEGIATRAPRQVSPSSGDAEGIATRARGYRHATQKDPRKDPQNDPTPADRVFDHWTTTTGKTKGARLTAKRRKLIDARLAEGYSEADLFRAVDGNRASAFHQGENEDGTVYDSLELICRSGEKVEFFMGKAKAAPQQNQTPEEWAAQHTARALAAAGGSR